MGTILTTLALNDDQKQQIMDAAPGYQLIEAPRRDQNALLELAPQAEIWFGGGVRPDVFRVATNLKWIQAISAGVDRYLFPELVQSPVQLTNVRGMHKDTIADHTFMFMLALARQLKRFIHLQAGNEWVRGDNLFELKGDTIGIIGLGSIGREIARRAKVFRMRVIGTNTSGSPVEGVDEVYGPGELETVIRQSRWLVIAAPLTPQTRGMIGEQQLEWLGPDGYLINISRGGLINQDALVRALQNNTIAGAGLDVFEEEPLPADSPLWHLPNVLITPHVSGSMKDYFGEALKIFCDNLKRYVKGEPLNNVVNKELGY